MKISSKPLTKKPSKITNGIALIATILILAMCFSSLLTVLSLTSLSLKRGGKSQYHSYQALLAAESGVNSFTARASQTLFDTSDSDLSLHTLNTWLESNNLDELSLLENEEHSIQNTLQFSNLTPQGVTLDSVGTVQNTLESGESTTLSKKILRVDFKLYRAGSSLQIQPNAALTTLGDIELAGSAALTGAIADDWIGLIRNYDEARANPTHLPNSTKFQLRVQHPNRFHAGQYIELQSGRYKVTTVDNNANSLELLALPSQSTGTLSAEEIALIPLALSTELPASNDNNIELPISNSKHLNFAIGQSISINSFEATITSLGENSITISWSNGSPEQTLPEGSTISLGILSARSSNTIYATDSNSLTGGKEENANLTVSSMFEQSFGLSKDELLGQLNAYDQRNGKSFELQIGSALESTPKLEGLYYTEDSIHFSTSQPLCGSALLVVAAELVVDAVCDEGFSGLLYIFGNYTQTDGHINGAVVSETSTLLSNAASISYSATALNQWQAYLQDSLASTDGKQNFQQVLGSWRLE